MRTYSVPNRGLTSFKNLVVMALFGNLENSFHSDEEIEDIHFCSLLELIFNSLWAVFFMENGAEAAFQSYFFIFWLREMNWNGFLTSCEFILYSFRKITFEELWNLFSFRKQLWNSCELILYSFRKQRIFERPNGSCLQIAIQVCHVSQILKAVPDCVNKSCSRRTNVFKLSKL